jgi:hypothetical protein
LEPSIFSRSERNLKYFENWLFGDI